MAKQVDWIRLHNAFYEDDDIEELSDAAFRAWLKGICLSDRLNTDGRLSKLKVAGIAKPKVRDELVTAGRWLETIDGGVEIVNYLNWQRSAEDKRSARKQNAERQEAHRLGISVAKLRARNSSSNALRERDGSVIAGAELEVEKTSFGNKTTIAKGRSEAHYLKDDDELQTLGQSGELDEIVRRIRPTGTDDEIPF